MVQQHEGIAPFGRGLRTSRSALSGAWLATSRVSSGRGQRSRCGHRAIQPCRLRLSAPTGSSEERGGFDVRWRRGVHIGTLL